MTQMLTCHYVQDVRGVRWSPISLRFSIPPLSLILLSLLLFLPCLRVNAVLKMPAPDSMSLDFSTILSGDPSLTRVAYCLDECNPKATLGNYDDTKSDHCTCLAVPDPTIDAVSPLVFSDGYVKLDVSLPNPVDDYFFPYYRLYLFSPQALSSVSFTSFPYLTFLKSSEAIGTTSVLVLDSDTTWFSVKPMTLSMRSAAGGNTVPPTLHSQTIQIPLPANARSGTWAVVLRREAQYYTYASNCYLPHQCSANVNSVYFTVISKDSSVQFSPPSLPPRGYLMFNVPFDLNFQLTYTGTDIVPLTSGVKLTLNIHPQFPFPGKPTVSFSATDLGVNGGRFQDVGVPEINQWVFTDAYRPYEYVEQLFVTDENSTFTVDVTFETFFKDTDSIGSKSLTGLYNPSIFKFRRDACGAYPLQFPYLEVFEIDAQSLQRWPILPSSDPKGVHSSPGMTGNPAVVWGRQYAKCAAQWWSPQAAIQEMHAICQIDGSWGSWSNQCTPCVKGEYYQSDSQAQKARQCIPCAQGTYAIDGGQTVCSTCYDTNWNKRCPDPGCNVCTTTGECKPQTFYCYIKQKCYPDGASTDDDVFGCSLCAWQTPTTATLPSDSPYWWRAMCQLPKDRTKCYQGKLQAVLNPATKENQCNSTCEYCAYDGNGWQSGCVIKSPYCWLGESADSVTQCGCSIGGQCYPLNVPRSPDFPCQVSSINNVCTGQWQMTPTPQISCVDTRNMCTHGGFCVGSTDGHCVANINTNIAQPCDDDSTRSPCDGKNDFSWQVYQEWDYQVCQARLLNDSCTRDLYCLGFRTCEGQFRDLPVVSISGDPARAISFIGSYVGYVNSSSSFNLSINAQLNCGTLHVSAKIYLSTSTTDGCGASNKTTLMSYSQALATPLSNPVKITIRSPTGALASDKQFLLFCVNLTDSDYVVGVPVSSHFQSVQSRVQIDITSPTPGNISLGGNSLPGNTSTPVTVSWSGESDDTNPLWHVYIDILSGVKLLPTSPPTAFDVVSKSVLAPFPAQVSLGSIIARKTVIDLAGNIAIAWSNILVLDPTPPVLSGQVVFDCGYDKILIRAEHPYQNHTDLLTVCFNGTGPVDPESGVSHLMYSVASSFDGVRYQVLPGYPVRYESTDYSRFIVPLPSPLANHFQYRVSVTAYNAADLASETVTTPGVLVQTDPPNSGNALVVAIGASDHKQINAQARTDQLCVAWSPDGESRWADDYVGLRNFTANLLTASSSGGSSGSALLPPSATAFSVTATIILNATAWNSPACVPRSILPLAHVHWYAVEFVATSNVDLVNRKRSAAVLIDTTPPVVSSASLFIYDVDETLPVDFTPFPRNITVRLQNVVDQDSGIVSVSYCLRVFSNGTLNPSCSASSSLPYSSPNPYFTFTADALSAAGLSQGAMFAPMVIVRNGAGLLSNLTGPIVLWDVLVPQQGIVSDGPVVGNDIDFQLSTRNLSITWSNFSFTVTDIGWWEVSCGTFNNTALLCDRQRVPAAQSNFTLTNLQLEPFASYRCMVTAVKQNDPDLVTISVLSNGVRIVTEPPMPPDFVADGSLTGTDFDWQTNLTAFFSSWGAFPHRGVPVYYLVQVQQLNDQNRSYVRNVGNPHSTMDVWSTFTFDPPITGVYRVRICASNPVNLSICLTTDGIQLDNTPPTIGEVRNGVLPDRHLPFQNSNQGFAINWSGFDAPSGIAYFDWCVGLSNGTCEVLSWTRAGAATDAHAVRLTKVSDGQLLVVSVRAVANNGLSTLAFSPPVQIETQEPFEMRLFPLTGMCSEPNSMRVNCTHYIPSVAEMLNSWRQVGWQLTNQSSTGSVDSFKWAVGVRPYSAELSPFQFLSTNHSLEEQLSYLPLERLQPKHSYFFSILTQAPSGVIYVTSSQGYEVDPTPPVLQSPLQLISPELRVSEQSAPLVAASNASTLWLLANWVDPESGIAQLQYAILPFQNSTVDEEQWITTVFNPISFIIPVDAALRELEQYWIYVRCVNGAGLISLSSMNFSVDTVPPVIQGDDDQLTFVGSWIRSVDQAYAPRGLSLQSCQRDSKKVELSWPVFTAASGIIDIQVAFGSSYATTDVLPWTSTGVGALGVRSRSFEFMLVDGQILFASVRAVSGSGLLRTLNSNGLMISTQPPALTGNPVNMASESYFDCAAGVDINWDGVFIGLVSDIMYTVGSSVNGTQALPWTRASASEILARQVHIDSSLLHTGVEYHARVAAFTCSGLRVEVSSAWSFCDRLPPAAAGSLNLPQALSTVRGENGLVYLTPTITLHVQWSEFLTTISPLSHFSVQVWKEDQTLGNSTADETGTEQDTLYFSANVGATFNETILQLTEAIPQEFAYRVEVTAVAISGLMSSSSVRFSIDSTEPISAPVRLVPYPSLDFAQPGCASDSTSAALTCQRSTNVLHVLWEPFDEPESALSSYEVCISSADLVTNSAIPCDVITWSPVSNLVRRMEFEMQLVPGQAYVASVRAWNAVNLTTAASSAAVWIAPSAPTPAFNDTTFTVVLESLSDSVNASEFGRFGIAMITWPQFVSQAGLPTADVRYEYSISTSANAQQLLPWTDLVFRGNSSSSLLTALLNLSPEGLSVPVAALQGVQVFVAVRATGCNDLSVSAVSNSLLLDNTIPELSAAFIPEELRVVSLEAQNFAWVRDFDSLRLRVQVRDDESYISRFSFAMRDMTPPALLIAPDQHSVFSRDVAPWLSQNVSLLSDAGIFTQYLNVYCDPEVQPYLSPLACCGSSYSLTFQPLSVTNGLISSLSIIVNFPPIPSSVMSLQVPIHTCNGVTRCEFRTLAVQRLRPLTPPIVQVNRRPEMNYNPLFQSNQGCVSRALLSQYLFTWANLDNTVGSHVVLKYELGISSDGNSNVPDVVPFVDRAIEFGDNSTDSSELLTSIALEVVLNQTEFHSFSLYYPVLRVTNVVGLTSVRVGAAFSLWDDVSSLPLGLQVLNSLAYLNQTYLNQRDRLEFSWNDTKPADDMPDFTYFIMLGTSDGGSQLLSPVALPSFDGGSQQGDWLRSNTRQVWTTSAEWKPAGSLKSLHIAVQLQPAPGTGVPTIRCTMDSAQMPAGVTLYLTLIRESCDRQSEATTLSFIVDLTPPLPPTVTPPLCVDITCSLRNSSVWITTPLDSFVDVDVRSRVDALPLAFSGSPDVQWINSDTFEVHSLLLEDDESGIKNVEAMIARCANDLRPISVDILYESCSTLPMRPHWLTPDSDEVTDQNSNSTSSALPISVATWRFVSVNLLADVIFYVVVVSTNGAGLTSVQSVQLRLDISPPSLPPSSAILHGAWPWPYAQQLSQRNQFSTVVDEFSWLAMGQQQQHCQVDSLLIVSFPPWNSLSPVTNCSWAASRLSSNNVLFDDTNLIFGFEPLTNLVPVHGRIVAERDLTTSPVSLPRGSRIVVAIECSNEAGNVGRTWSSGTMLLCDIVSMTENQQQQANQTQVTPTPRCLANHTSICL